MTLRSLTLLVVPANTAEAIDAMGWSARRETGGGWTRIDLLHAGEPDVLLRRTLDLDLSLGVYRRPRVWDEDDRAVVVTSLAPGDRLGQMVELLAPHLAAPQTLAKRLVAAAESDEDPARVARMLAEPLADLAQGPAEEAAAYVRVLRAHISEALERGMGVAWEYRVPAPCACAVWDGTTLGLSRGFPRSQFATLASEDGTGRIRCTQCRATFTFVSTTTHTVVTREPARTTLELDGDEIDRVIAGIRDGARVDIGGSRCHTTYFGRDGSLFVEDFDEGATTERAFTEPELRAVIVANPGEFVEVLRRPLREVLRRALVGASETSPHEAMRDLLVYGECLTRRHLLQAVLVWPDVVTLSPDAMTELTTLADGNEVYHFIRSAVGYSTSTPQTGRFGLRVFTALAEMLGRELPHWRKYRSDFRAMAGDIAGAIEDLEWERTHLPADDIERPYVERAIAKLADAQLLADIVAAPDDDAPRLVWADILTERGDPRGEFIVAQCRLQRLDEDGPERAALHTRAGHLAALHGRAWGKKGQTWQRGFPISMEIRWREHAALFDEAFAFSPPLTGLHFRTYRNEMMADPARVLEDPRLAKLVDLDFTVPIFKLDGAGGETVVPFGSAIVQRLVGRFPDLHELRLRSVQLSVDDLRSIGPRPKLRTLDLGGVPMRGATDALVGDHAFPGLRVLRLDHCELVDDDVLAFARLPILAELVLSDNAIRDRGAHVLAKLGMRSLRLAGSAVGDDGAAALGEATSLRTLDVERSRVGNAGVARLAELELACLLLEENPFDETAVAVLGRGRVATTLRRLTMGPPGEQRFAGKAIRALAGMPRLWQLLVKNWAIEGDDVIALLEGLPALRALGLTNCALDDAGLAKVVAHPAFERLDVLEINHGNLGPDAGAILARAPRLPARLFLNNNRLGDAGARALAEAPGVARVADLILQDNAITEEGARALVGESSQLVATVGKLCLHDNAIGAEAAKLCTDSLGPRFCYASK